MVEDPRPVRLEIDCLVNCFTSLLNTTPIALFRSPLINDPSLRNDKKPRSVDLAPAPASKGSRCSNECLGRNLFGGHGAAGPCKTEPVEIVDVGLVERDEGSLPWLVASLKVLFHPTPRAHDAYNDARPLNPSLNLSCRRVFQKIATCARAQLASTCPLGYLPSRLTKGNIMGTRWIIEGSIDDRWPINTRGNVGEVFPEVVTALGFEYAVRPAERAWRQAYVDLGIHNDGDFSSDEPVIIGLYGGYTYLNLSYLRMMGVRAPGSSAEAIDVAFFGEGNPPPYEPRDGDKSIKSSLKILLTVLKALGQKDLPEPATDSFKRVAAFEAKRPSLDADDDVLLAYLDSFPAAFEPVFANHMKTTALAAIVSGVLADAATAAGKPGLVTELIGAAGDVHSAQYSVALYEIAKQVKASSSMTAAFDTGVDGLLGRLPDDDDGAAFTKAFDAFTAEHGQRGPNDWELSARTWDNTPELALAAIDSMRRADHDLSPANRLADDDSKRAAAIEAVRPHVKFLDKLNFDKAIKAAPYWAQGREATRDRAVRIMLPVKQVYRELVRRGAERGGIDDPVRVALLEPKKELRDYLKDPSSMLGILEERGALFDRYAAVEPRFFISSQSEVPTLEELEAENAERAGAAAVGDVLKGDAGSSGVARGKARVVLDPADGSALEPGEILVAPLTDPSWTPLFLPAEAVVVNVGALMSHAVIVARELAIPAVIALEGATERIETGMLIEVDGTAGTVTVIES